MSPHALAVEMFAVAPTVLGGLRLRARSGPEREGWLAALRGALEPGTPWIRLPAHVDDEALNGGVDLAATLGTGRVVRTRGLLERARGGVLVAAMAERMSAALAARLALAADSGEVALLLLDEGIDGDEAPPVSLLDRTGVHVLLQPRESAPEVDSARMSAARARWRTAVVEDRMIEALVETAAALGIDSMRATHQAVLAARIAAALAGRAEADADAAAQAVQVVLAPRATRCPQDSRNDADRDAQESTGDPPPPDGAPPETPTPEQPSSGASTPGPEEPRPADDQREDPGPPLAERLVAAARTTLPADVLSLLGAGAPRRGASASGRMGGVTKSFSRGRSIGVQRGEPRDGARLALVETLRCAAPWQRARREAVGAHDVPVTGVIVHRSDLRVQRREQRRSTTTIFAIDASGSQAMSRLAEAKGAVELLLADCYARRDSVAVIAFRGTRATLLLAPTRSLVRARRELAGLPGGGGTPLASGLEAARALAETAVRAGSTPLVVLLTDGRANITLRGEPGRAAAATDALAAGRALARGGFAALMIDTADHPSQAARTLAEAMRARYVPLPHAGARAVSAAVRRERDTAGPVARRD